MKASLIVLCILMLAGASFAMPPLNGGPLPDFAPGVNVPDERAPARDDADLEGEWNLLILLVDFEDYTWDMQDDENFNNEGNPWDVEHFGSMLFTNGEYAHPGSESDYTGSMRDYYNEVSGELFTVTGVVTEWYRAAEPLDYYVAGENGTGMNYPRNSQGLVEEIVTLADDDIDFSDYDNDGDGIVDALVIVHAGPGAEMFGRGEAGDRYIWSHKWSVRENIVLDDVMIRGYNVNPQDGTIGVFCHEFGHTLGLPDLYDIDGSSSGIGEWGLMSGGGWCNRTGDPAGSSPSHMIGWSKMELGWVEVIDVQDPMEDVVIPPVASEHVIYRIWTDGVYENEYYLLENRRRIGFDEGLLRRQIDNDLPAPEGLLITHIDMNQRGFNNQDNTDDAHRLVDVEEASVVWIDGVPTENLDIQPGGDRGDLFLSNRGDNGDLWPGFIELNEQHNDWVGDRSYDRFSLFSIPNSIGYNGAPSLVDVYDIRLDGENVVLSLTHIPPDDPLLFIEEWTADDSEGGNGNGYIEAGETFNLSVSLTNIGLQDASEITATLEYDGEYAVVEVGEVQYPDIISGGTGEANGHFEISVMEEAPLRGMLSFSLTITSEGDLEFSYRIDIEMRPERDWFKYYDNPVLRGAEDEWDASILSPAIIIEEETLRCWYVGGNPLLNPPSPGAIGYAESADGGFTWERSEAPMLTPDDAEWMNLDVGGIAVAEVPGMGYLMAIAGVSAVEGDTVSSIGFAISEDGMEWETLAEPTIEADFESLSEIFPTQLAIIEINSDVGLWGLMFTGMLMGGFIPAPAIFLAQTIDFEEWIINPDIIIAGTMQENDFDAYATFAPDVTVMDNGFVRVLYSGFGMDGVGRLGEITTDGVELLRYPGVETGGSILAPGGVGGWVGEDMIFGARYFEWRGEPRLLFTGAGMDRDIAAVGLALPQPVSSAPKMKDDDIQIPSEVTLEPAFPNPFNSTTSIKYNLRHAGDVTVGIFDLSGREVIRIFDGWSPEGQNQVAWDGSASSGKSVSSGLYFVRVSLGVSRAQGKLLLVR